MIAEFPVNGELPVGGPQVAVARLVATLGEHGVDVVVVAPDPGGSRERVTELEGGIRVVAVPAGNRLTLARQMQPWRRRTTAVVRRLGVDLVHGQGLLPGVAATDVAELPVVVTARGNARADTVAAYRGLGARARALLRDRLAARAIDRADVVVGVNPDPGVNLPRPPRRFVYVPNMVEESLFTLERDVEPGLVVYAGGSRAIKGWSLLAAAWPYVRRRFPAARLNVAGWPPAEGPPPGISAADRASLIVEGWLSSSELADRMARAAVVVIPSQFEVSPIVLAEAWALRRPVVAAQVGGIPALATDAAVLVERTPQALADGILESLSGGEPVDALVAEGRRRAERHRPEAVAEAHRALYDELLASA